MPISPPSPQPLKPRRDWYGATAIALVAGGLVFGAVLWLWWGKAWSAHALYLVKTALWYSAGLFEDAARYYQLKLSFVGKLKDLVAVAGGVAGSGLTFAALIQEIQPEKHVSGRQLWRGNSAITAAKSVSAAKAAISGGELKIHKSLTLARHQVMQSMLLMAAQGGGKTQLIWRILSEMIRSNYKLVIFDLAKGDYTQSLNKIDRLFALGDARSSVWAVWEDVKTQADAEAFAAGMIPQNEKDPMWANAARGVLIAILLKLIYERGPKWRWPDLAELAFSQAAELKSISAQYYPPAASAVADEESKTTASILINLHAFLGPLFRIGQEWAEYDLKFPKGKPREFSWISWLNDDQSHDRTIVLQSNAKDRIAATGLIRAMMEVQVGHVASLEYPESKTRSIIYILDELPQLGVLSCLTTILEVGRSKGVALLLAFQDISQIRQIWPHHTDQKWLAMLGLRIFGQVKGGDSQEFVLKQIGMRIVDRPMQTVTTNAAGYSVANSYQRTEVPILPGSDLELLGPQKNGIKAIVLGHGQDALELEWPYYSPQNYRPAKVPKPSQAPLAVAVSEVSMDTSVLPVLTPEAATPPEPENEVADAVASEVVAEVLTGGAVVLDLLSLIDKIDGSSQSSNQDAASFHASQTSKYKPRKQRAVRSSDEQE